MATLLRDEGMRSEYEANDLYSLSTMARALTGAVASRLIISIERMRFTIVLGEVRSLNHNSG